MPGTESMHELMLSIFNIKLEANEELNGLSLIMENIATMVLFSHINHCWSDWCEV